MSKPNRTYKIPLVWQLYGYAYIEASTLEEAVAHALGPDCPLPEGNYLDDSVEVDKEGLLAMNDEEIPSMNSIPSKAAIEALRARYIPGSRVELTEPMDDPYATLKPGDQATVTGVDCHGDILCAWDCGSTLKLIPGVDEFKFLGSGGDPVDG